MWLLSFQLEATSMWAEWMSQEVQDAEEILNP